MKRGSLLAILLTLPLIAPAVTLPPQVSSTEVESAQTPEPLPPDQRIGIAVVGLGRLALEEVLPAFGQAKAVRLAALVSGDPKKMPEIGAHYGITPEHQYTYTTFEKLKDDSSVQAVYIILPNSLHKEYTVRAAAIGKHVLSEKPMATSVSDAEAMIAACQKAHVKLMIAYRLQYEPYNRAMIELVRSHALGALRAITSENSHDAGNPAQWRLKEALSGGGPLPDMGIYCFNADRYLTGEEPDWVWAATQRLPQDPRFKEVESGMTFVLHFPSGVLASNYTGYAAHKSQRYRLLFADGWADLDPAFPYQGLRMRIARKEGAAERIEEKILKTNNQFADELDNFADSITHNRVPHTPGEEGLQDMKIIEALYQSAKTNKPVTLTPSNRLDAFRGPLRASKD